MVQLSSSVAQGELRNYVDGEWVAVESEGGQDAVNPATGETLAHVPFSTGSEVDRAVAAAQDAFEDWRSRAVEERTQPLFELKRLLEEHRDELAELLVQDQGKTRAEADGEMHRAIQNVEHACGGPTLMQSGGLVDAAPEIDEAEVRLPLGVFTAITPFNFPVFVPLWYLPYAAVTGNAIVLKPSEVTPMATQRLFELIDEAGFPDGLIQLVNGGPDTVTALLEHDGVVGASFVGSTPVAKQVYETASAAGIRVQAQGGAKNPVIVTQNADLEFAAEKAVGGAYACMGERCLATDTAIVEESVYDEFLDHVLDAVDDITLGYGLDSETDMGPMITPEQKGRVENYIETGVQEGATLHRDGRGASVEAYPDGNFLGPTVFGDVTRDMVIGQKEIFGPVLAVMRATDFDEAIELANRTEFGNAACLYTTRGGEARRFRHEVEAGNLGVNVGTAAPLSYFHMGGRKASFFGDLHAQGQDIVDFYTDRATYIERWPDGGTR